MKYSQLIQKCVELIDSFDQKIMTPDSHAEEFLTVIKCEDTERVFMKQIFYGCQRYRQFLKVSNNAIFVQFSGSTNRKNDGTLFAIFTYIICFRMDELPFVQFKKIMFSQDAVKMNVLLTFIFNFDGLRQNVFQKWQEHLELDYLQSKLLPKLIQRKQKCQQLIAKISQNATGKKFQGSFGNTQQNIQEGKDKKKGTVVQEFNLTKPKPKQIPQLQRIEVGFKANPAPKNSKDLKLIEEQKAKRRKQIQQNIKTYYEQNKKKQQFEFETSKRPSNLPKIKQQVQKMQTKQLQKKIKAKPMPKYEQVDVKLNVGAILRQQKKLKQKIQQQQRRMKDLQINMRDESEFENWKKQMKQKDKYEQMQNQQKRKIQMQLARQAAIDAYQQKIQQKRNLVQDMKLIASQLKMERQKLEQLQLQDKKKLIQEVQECKENIKVQQQKLLLNNKKIHDEEKQERRRILEKKKEEEKIEMQKKKELIQEIKELEKKIKARPKQQIQHVSIGLLQQMTLDQLQLKLMDVKRERRQQQQKKREVNNKKKEQFKETINDKKNFIMAHRQELTRQKQEQKRKKKQQAQLQKQRLQQVKTKSINQYKKKQQKKAQQKRVQKQKLSKQIKQTQQRRMFLMQGQAQQQANAFKNLQKGQERQILDRQNTKLMQQYKNQTVKQSEMRVLADKNKREVKKKIEFNKLYNEEQEMNNKLAEEIQQEDMATKAEKYQQIRTFQQKHNQNMMKSNPYKAKISQMSLTRAKGTTKK